jgi:hypothetical protein
MDEERTRTGAWSSVEVQCPFWKGETTRAICCEGLRKGEVIRRLLPDKEAKKKELRKYCCKNYELCGIFQMVYGGYK